MLYIQFSSFENLLFTNKTLIYKQKSFDKEVNKDELGLMKCCCKKKKLKLSCSVIWLYKIDTVI